MNLFDNKKPKYAEIFNQRGSDYHRAMMLLPDARSREFKNLTNRIDLSNYPVIVDMPSGGNYIKNYVPNNIKIIPLETSEIFAQLANTKTCDWTNLPVSDNSVDIIICCAAFHHVVQSDRLAFREESERILRNDGKLLIADVEHNTPVAGFLNGFVNDFNSLGHVGDFIDQQFGLNFASSSLQVISNDLEEFQWVFDSDLNTSIRYISLLFGIDKADQNEIIDYLKQHLNLRKNMEGKYCIDWSLRYVEFKKT